MLRLTAFLICVLGVYANELEDHLYEEKRDRHFHFYHFKEWLGMALSEDPQIKGRSALPLFREVQNSLLKANIVFWSTMLGLTAFLICVLRAYDNESDHTGINPGDNDKMQKKLNVTAAWQAGVFVRDKFYCGGSILSMNKVLIPARGFGQGGNNTLRHDQVTVGVGSPSLRKLKMYSVKSIQVYSKPGRAPTPTDTNIAVITLAENLTFSAEILPIPLANAEAHPQPGDKVSLFGWRYHTTGDLVHHYPQVISFSLCTQLFQYYESTTTMSFTPIFGMACTGKPGRGPCPGEEGGGLIRHTKNIPGYELVAVLTETHGCYRYLPSTYIDITFRVIHDWIISQMLN